LGNNRLANLAAEAEQMQQDLGDADSINGGTVYLVDMINLQNLTRSLLLVLLGKSLDFSICSSNYNIRSSKFGVSRIYTSNSNAYRVAAKTLTTANFGTIS